MPEISRFFGIIIAMFYNEHGPPHFHARYGRYKIAVNIDDLSVLAGEFPPRALGLVVEWSAQHQTELRKNWELAGNNQSLIKIPPLE